MNREWAAPFSAARGLFRWRRRKDDCIAIVGASARSAASFASHAGFDVVTADLFADADLTARLAPGAATRVDNFPEGLAEWLARQDVDAWIYTGALENHPELIDRMAQIRPLWGNRGEPLRRCRDPMELQRLFGNACIPFPKTYQDRVGLPADGTWLCKTYRGASGSAVWSLDGTAAATRADQTVTYFQKRFDAPPASVVYACTRDRFDVLLLSEQLVGRNEFGAAGFRYCGSAPMTRGLTHRQRNDLHEIGAVACGDLGLRGVVGVDVLLLPDRLMVVEINPRFPASINDFQSDQT